MRVNNPTQPLSVVLLGSTHTQFTLYAWVPELRDMCSILCVEFKSEVRTEKGKGSLQGVVTYGSLMSKYLEMGWCCVGGEWWFLGRIRVHNMKV